MAWLPFQRVKKRKSEKEKSEKEKSEKKEKLEKCPQIQVLIEL